MFALTLLGVMTCCGVGLLLYYARRKVIPVMGRMVAPVSIVEMTQYVALPQSDGGGSV